MIEFAKRPNHRQLWTADELDQLCAFFSLRKPVREIARTMGRSQEAVRAKAQQLDRLGGASL